MEGIREIELEKIKVGLEQSVSQYLLDVSVDIDILSARFTNQVVFHIKGFLWGEKLPTKTIRYPSDWWQAFKARWFPEWLLKRYPAKYTTQHITASIIYPGLNPSIPDRTWRLKMWINEYNEFWSSERN